MNKIFIVVVVFLCIMVLNASENIPSSTLYKGNLLRTGVFDDSVIEKSPEIKWIFDTKLKKQITAQPIIYEKTLFVGSHDSYFYALDTEKGKLKWKFKADGFITQTAAIANGKVVFVTANSHIYVLDTATGKKIWDKSYFAGAYCKSTPTIYENVIYIGSTIQSEFEEDMIDFTGFDLDTGELVWTYPIRGSNTAPIISEGKIYFNDGWHMLCVEIATKKLIWKTKLEQWIDATPVLIGNILITGDIEKGMKAIHRLTGKIVWKKDFQLGISDNTYCASNELLFLIDTGLLCINSSNGDVIWNKSLSRGFYPIIINNYIFGGDDIGNLYCYSTKDGSLIWSKKVTKINDSIYNLVSFDKTLYFGTFKGFIYAIY